jgi:D-amino-acid dehydrogenase
MLDSSSPFRIEPRLDARLASWMWRFWRSCSAEHYRAGMAALLRLNASTFDLFDDLRASGLEFEMESPGVLFVALDEAALAEYVDVFTQLVELGYSGEVEQLSGDGIREREPALSDAVIGGLHAHGERFLRPESLNAALEGRLRERGVEVADATVVSGLGFENGQWRVAVSGGDVVVDAVLVAAGAWSGELLRSVSLKVPLQGAKGYSFTAALDGARPVHPLYLAGPKIAFTPFASASRIAGRLELTGLDLVLDRRRLREMISASAEYIRPPLGRAELEWCGLRSLAPDGLPLIGQVPGRPRLYIAAGHGMLGITLAPATAVALKRMIVEGEEPNELEPFAPPARFIRTA